MTAVWWHASRSGVPQPRSYDALVWQSTMDLQSRVVLCPPQIVLTVHTTSCFIAPKHDQGQPAHAVHEYLCRAPPEQRIDSNVG